MNAIKRFFKRFWAWFTGMPSRFKEGWINYKQFAKEEYKRNKILMDYFLGIDREEKDKNGKK